MKYAAIDIGSNSVRLLLADQTAGDVKGKKYLKSTRIAQGMAETGELSPAAMARTKEAIAQFAKQALDWGASRPVFCYATSAVREAQNGEEFMDSLAGIDGLEYEIIDGKMEAQVAYIGAAAKDKPVLDIGGGSTEIIVCEGGETKSRSMRLGCVTVLERYMDTDPPAPGQVAAMDAYCLDSAAQLIDGIVETCNAIVGVGGTATQLAMLQLELPAYDAGAVDGYYMEKAQLQSLYHRLCAATDQQRKQMPGMDKERSDIIVSGTAVLLAVLQACGASGVYASDGDGLDGYLLSRIKAAPANGPDMLY